MSERVPAKATALAELREELQSLEPSLRLNWRVEQTLHTWAARRASRPWASPRRWVAVAATLAAVVTAGWALHRPDRGASSARGVGAEATPARTADAEVMRVRASLGATARAPQVAAWPATGQRYWIDLGVSSDGSVHVVRVMPADDDEERPVY
jgi:hypothetical protein